MADERDFELLDDYLTNRLSEQDRSAFEQKLQADPNLQQEYVLQQRLVKGIQDARVAELKAMFNDIPVSAIGPEKTLASKIAIGTAVSILIALGAYWYFSNENSSVSQQNAPSEETSKDEVTPDVDRRSETESEEADTETNIETDKNQTSAGTEHSKPSQEKKPRPIQAPQETKTEGGTKSNEPVVDVFDPTTEENTRETASAKEPEPVLNRKGSSLLVETVPEHRRYSFHYQFRDGKLFLYGPLEKNLYEIMEFFSDEKRTVFLYYKDNYYLLEEKDFSIHPLTPISDVTLLKKLKEYRSKK
jgi:hypothetical protein